MNIAREIKKLEARKLRLKELIELHEEVDQLERAWLLATKPPLIISLIAEIICEKFNVTLQSIMSEARPEAIVIPRHALFYLARKLSGGSLNTIGRALHRDHGSILHGAVATQNRMDTDKHFCQLVTDLEAKCKAKLEHQTNGEHKL